MINYSIDSAIRRKIIVFFFVISLLLVKPINMILTVAYDFTIRVLPFTEDCFDLFSKIGISVSEVSLLSVFAILYVLFCKFVWKIKLVAKMTGIPDLSGAWEGKLISSYINPETNKKAELDMTVEIIQDWNSISIRSKFPESSSYSKTASLHINEQKGIVLGFSYRNDSMNVDIDSREFSGYNELTYKIDTLEGVYFTNRNDGTHGIIKLKKRKKESEK